MKNCIVMMREDYAPEIQRFDAIYYDNEIDPYIGCYVVYSIGKEPITADKVDGITEHSLQLHNGTMIHDGDSMGVAYEVRRTFGKAQEALDLMGDVVNTYHMKRPETPINKVWKAVADLMFEELEKQSEG